MNITEKDFGQYDGQTVIEYTLANDLGMTVSCLNFGCVITKMMVPDRHGKVENVVLGFDSLEDYLEWSPYFGAIVGRVAGRIQGSRFELDGKEFTLAANEAPNHLHGGRKGFNSVIWQTELFKDNQSVGVKFFYHSPDGEEGYPGNLETTVTYLLNNDNELKITYEAKTDQKTPVNLTNHSYFNLSGNSKRDCSDHTLKLDNDRFIELGPDLIPTGKLLHAEGTSFDFREGRKIEDGIQSTHPQNILAGNGYDHPIVFSQEGENTILLSDEESGRSLEVTTNQPCVVLYTSNQLEGPFSIDGVPARNYLGVCLETQGFPDAIHHPEFPSVVLKPEEKYYQETTYRFLVKQ
ncbi:aldose epimerase family protein [Neobacillus kokaensis]|uniref:Aldose 1-epimerase n=1 Tax=Neobacillus kokaensis TaxID=2759023 RepID=A0ABQ3N9S7_9BACI|nr:aldose epimerase family protein [Neobacillus kokaensis]GHH99535.1 aldose 1-epimerase [Neobacillus kokaensis]